MHRARYTRTWSCSNLVPEYLVGIMITAVLGWGGFTWRKAEDAITRAIQTSDRVDRLEVKIAENYLTKQELQAYMDRMFETLGEMKGGMQYLTERVDFHVSEQAGESRELKAEIERLRTNTQRRRIDD